MLSGNLPLKQQPHTQTKNPEQLSNCSGIIYFFLRLIVTIKTVADAANGTSDIAIPVDGLPLLSADALSLGAELFSSLDAVLLSELETLSLGEEVSPLGDVVSLFEEPLLSGGVTSLLVGSLAFEESLLLEPLSAGGVPFDFSLYASA